MLYILTGTDSNKRRLERDKIVLSISDDETYTIRRDDVAVSVSEIEETAGTSNLFGKPIVMIFEEALADEVVREKVSKLTSLLADSVNHFIFSETTLSKEILSRFQKKALHSHHFDLKKEVAIRDNSGFALTDSFCKRDKKKTWMLYRIEIEKGKDPHELIGLLFWAVKSMIISEKSKDANEAGLNPFVFKKSKSASVNFKGNELLNFSKSLIDFYHNARNGDIEWEEGLESLILKKL